MNLYHFLSSRLYGRTGRLVARLERHLALAQQWQATHPTKVADVPPDA